MATKKAVKKVAKKATKKLTNASPLQVGRDVFIRCVTHYLTGHVEAVTEQEIVLSNAAWVADTGRFSQALTAGELNEVEPFPDVVSVGRGAIVDATIWRHALPTAVK